MKKPLIITLISVGIILTGGALYSVLKKQKEKSTSADSEFDEINDEITDEAEAEVEDMIEAMNSDSPPSETEYKKYLKKEYPKFPGSIERYKLLFAGTYVSDAKAASLARYSSSGRPKWIIDQARQKVAQGKVNEVTNAIIGIQLWHQKKNALISNNQHSIAVSRLNFIDKLM